MLITFLADSSHAWSDLKKKTYTTSNGGLTFSLNEVFDYDDYIVYPTLIITPTINGNITISNTTTNETITLSNCITTEVITLDCKTDKIKSSNSRVMLDNWNKQTISIKEGKNNFVITGNFKMETRYRRPIRVCG